MILTRSQKQNIEKAKKEIERLEAEEAAEANGVNGKAEDKTVAEVTEGVKETTLEEKETETAAAAA